MQPTYAWRGLQAARPPGPSPNPNLNTNKF